MKIGIIGGTGIGERLLDELGHENIERHDVETPWGAPSDAIVTAEWEWGEGERVGVALLNRHGPGHRYPPHRVPYRANVFALKALGVTHVLSTGAVGSLREGIRPGELVLCDQFLDRTVSRARTFYDEEAVHIEFADPCCPVMRGWLLQASRRVAVTLHERGVHVVIEGPSFSTRAEAHMHRALGADVVGMTAMPEARLVREAEMAYALLTLPTDDDCWRPRPVEDPGSLLSEIRANLDRASESAFALISSALADVTLLRSTPSPAHTALEHAIWSAGSEISSARRTALHPLWGRVLQA